MVEKPVDTTYLILVRHTVTDWNNEYRFQGHADTPLNDEGRAAIPLVVKAVRFWDPSAIYSSDLLRARVMAETLGQELGLSVNFSEDLRECSYGDWEGKTLQEVKRERAGELERWRGNEAGYARGGGESLEEMQARSWSGMVSIADAHPGEAVAVFTHSGPIRGAVCRIFDLGIAQRYRFQADNGSLTVLRRSREGLWHLALLNQTVHLGKGAPFLSPVASLGSDRAPDQTREAER